MAHHNHRSPHKDHFDSHSISLRAEKKIAGGFATRRIAKTFLDDESSRLLDNLYRLLRDCGGGDKKQAEKVVKNTIKILLKVGLLVKHHQLSPGEQQLAQQLRGKFHGFALTLVSFVSVEFTYDRGYLIQLLTECETLIGQLIHRHLTQKSRDRVNMVFRVLASGTLLDACFARDQDRKVPRSMLAFSESLNKLIDSGAL